MTSTQQRPRIGIIGTGAIGGYYGLMLARAGFDVHFLLRSEFAAVSSQGLRVDSQVHGPLLVNPVNAHASAADMPLCDWLFVGAKTTSNADLAPLIVQAAAPGARVVLLQNGLGVEARLRELLPDHLHLLGGLCFIAVHRQAPGVVVHQSGGAVNLGYHSGTASEPAQRQVIVEEGAAMLRSAQVDCQAMVNLDQARWQKLVWNVPYNGLSVLLNTGTAALMSDVDTRELILDLMNEVIQGAAASGHTLPEGYAQTLFAFTQKMPDYLPSMFHDFTGHRALELQAIYASPLNAAQEAGFDMPKVRALYQALAFMDRRNVM